ncbi:MAG: hypothetical protein B7Z81_15815 [Acidocella sp. 20-61-6]|nr:MAG: hypothetical protein B7Z81_15815 [Acidocella sp. 20-61-6]
MVLAVPSAWAQSVNTVAVPPAPPIVAAPPAVPSAPSAPTVQPPPGLVQTPVPPAAPDAMSAPPASAPVAAPSPPNTWLPGSTATLGVLNKVDGSTSQVSIPVGGQQHVGDLNVSVLACVTRPPGQLPDTAIFLSVQNATQDSSAPIYHGWMVRSMPGAAVVGDASEIFRVIACS